MIRVDFTDVKDSGFEPLPEGEYEASVFEVEQRVGQQSGKPYLNWQFKILGGEYDGRRAFYMTSLSPAALWNLKATLKALGYTDEELSGNLELDLTDLPGRECRIVIEHEEYNGEMRDRVKKVLPVDGAQNSLTGDAPLYR